jgi:hypothetical protein
LRSKLGASKTSAVPKLELGNEGAQFAIAGARSPAREARALPGEEHGDIAPWLQRTALLVASSFQTVFQNEGDKGPKKLL